MLLPRLDRLPAHDRDLVEAGIVETERSRWNSECGRKHYRHRDPGAAAAHARRLSILTGLRYTVYPCDFGGDGDRHYHVGHLGGVR